MTYTPPLNGGRINLSIGGNSTSAGGGYSFVSTGNVILAGGNNITLSQNANTITISGGAGGAGGVALANSQTTYSSGTVNVLEGGGAITIASGAGQSLNFSVPQTSSLSATGQVSISNNGSTISIGAPNQTNQSLGIYGSSQTFGQSSSSTYDARSLTIVGRGDASVGWSNGSFMISDNPQSVQPGIASIQASNTTYTSGKVIFSNANGISFGSSAGSAITASYTVPTQTNQSVGLYAGSNTTVNTSGTADARSISFVGAGGVSVEATNGSVVISGGAGGGGFNAGMSTGGNTSGTTGTVTNQLIFAGGNNITLSQSTGAGGNTLSISAPNFATAAAAMAQQIAGNTSGTLSTISSGTMQWAGGNNITLSQSQQSVTISAGNGLGTLSRYEFPDDIFTSLNSAGQGSLSIEHMYVPLNVTGTVMKIGGSLSAATNTSATTASANVSLWMGIYTLNGSSLSLASSGSANNGFVWSHSASSTGNTSINSMRQMTVPMNVNMVPGEYWVAAVMSSATTYTSFGYTMYGNNQIAGAATGAVLTPIGSNTTANRDVVLFQGIYTAATSAGPASMSGGHINNTSASYVQRAGFYMAIFNATY